MRVTILKVSYVERQTPRECSCGTGYSEPDVFNIEFDKGGERYQVTKLIDIWCCPKEQIKDAFAKQMNGYGAFFVHVIDNMDEAFSMFLDELEKNRLCPWKKSEILAED